jgi:PAS domain S-box-containing protein
LKALQKNMLIESITKKQIFIIHLMVTIIICYLVIFGPTEGKIVIWSAIFIAFYLSSNLFILYIPNRYFIKRTIFYYLIFFNSFMICLGMYLSGNASTDFYLIYFLIMGISCMSISLKYLMINTTIFVVIYGYILYQKGLLGGEIGISYSLRLPFIIIIGLFFGYIVEALIKDKTRSLEVSEEKYRSLVESINDSMYVVDTDCQYLSANSNVLSEYGLTTNQIVGKKFSDFHSPEQTREFSDRVKKVIETGNTEQFEGYKEKLGKWVIRKLSPIKEPDTAKIRAISVVSMDITERVEIVKELIETNKKLKETQNQLIQNEKMAVIGRLASGLAHQIRNPLEIIIMGVEFLGNTIHSKDLKPEKSIEKIKQAVNRTNQIITDFLRFSRKSELKFESVDVCLLLDETIKLIEYRINEKKVKIERNYSEESIEVTADRNMLQQVFMNLLNNGIDAVSKGGEIRIKVNTKIIMHEHIEDRVGYRDNDYFKIGEKMTEIEIEDNGVGISRDVLQRIFEPFYTTKESEKGTGLGLSLAHLIIDRHQGKISVQSEVNKGTKFILKLQPVSS